MVELKDENVEKNVEITIPDDDIETEMVALK